MSPNISSASFLESFPGETVIDEFEVISRPRRLTVGDILITLVLLCFYVVPGLLYLLYCWLFRYAMSGHLVVSDRRLTYYSLSRNLIGRRHLVFQVRLRDISGITTTFSKKLGEQSVGIEIMTTYSDGFTIGMSRATWLRMLRPSNIGKDALRLLPALSGLVESAKIQTDNAVTY
jgi:hypothetical protein